MHETPANVSMGPERMTRPRWHDAGIAQELPAEVFNRPPAEAVLLEGRHVAVEFGVALGAIERAAQILRDLGSGVQHGKCVPVGLPPVPKYQPVSTDHRSLPHENLRRNRKGPALKNPTRCPCSPNRRSAWAPDPWDPETLSAPAGVWPVRRQRGALRLRRARAGPRAAMVFAEARSAAEKNRLSSQAFRILRVRPHTNVSTQIVPRPGNCQGD